MKSIKMFGLAVVAVLMAMAFVGASSAAAESTSLCDLDPGPGSHEVCPAGHLITHVHETTLSGAKATLLNSISNVLCDALTLSDVISSSNLGAPLEVKATSTYLNCVDEKPNACTVEEASAGSIGKVLKEGHETASATVEGEVKVVCSGISCVYKAEGLVGTGKGALLSSETNGSGTITDQTVKKVKGLLCPTTAKLDVTLTPLIASYITG